MIVEPFVPDTSLASNAINLFNELERLRASITDQSNLSISVFTFH